MAVKKSKNNFINFPLCLLSYPLEIDNRITNIISYSIVNSAIDLSYTLKGFNGFEGTYIPLDAELDKDLHCAILMEAKRLSYRIMSVSGTIDRYNDMKNYLEYYTGTNGRDTYARVPITSCTSAIQNLKLYEKFAVLCAVKAIQGKNRVRNPKFITTERIIAAANGYKKITTYTNTKTKGGNFTINLTPYKIKKYTIELSAAGHFSRLTFQRRHTYYSSFLDQYELAEAILKVKENRLRRSFEVRKIEDQLNGKFKTLRSNYLKEQ